jgi:Holliday junction resolvase RusA-like endonuclease
VLSRRRPRMETERAPILDFFVEGHPVPGGSKSAFAARRKDGSLVFRKGTNIPVVNMVDSGKGNKEWRRTVGWEAKRFMAFKSLLAGCPLRWIFNFWLKRPQNEFRANGELKDWAKRHHLSSPDVLKLCRSTEDALTGIVWHDDAQVVCGSFSKQYCGQGEKEGVRIRILAI